MSIHGIHAIATERTVSGASDEPGAVTRCCVPSSAATSSRACSACGSCGTLAGVGVAGTSSGNRHSSRGFHTNLRNSASVTSEKMPPPMSVSCQMGGSPYACAVAKKNWNAANDPPPTTSAGQTASVCRHVHMHFTM